MSEKSVPMDPELRQKGTMTVLLVALVMTAVWIVLLRMGFFAPVFGALVPLIIKKGYEYICDGSSALARRTLITVVSFVVSVVGTAGGYWAIFSAMYPDVMFFAVPYAMLDIFTSMPAYGTRFLVYLGVGLASSYIGILVFMKKPKDN